MIFPLQTISLSDKVEMLACQRNGFIRHYSPSTGFKLHGKRGDELTLSGLLSDFYEGYWRHHTSVERLFLCFWMSGHARVRVTRRDAMSACDDIVLDEECDGSGRPFNLAIPSSDGGNTRLFVSVDVLSDDVELSDIFWATDAAPAREIRATAVICTFNRDEELKATLQELLHPASGLFSIIVVNQGRADLQERIRDICPQHGVPLTIFEQPNYGGAGGFTRGMIEARADGRCTHVLLLDDDIDLDRQIIARLPIVLSYLRKDHCVGGAMLDLERREILFSVGDVLNTSGPGIRNLVDRGYDDMLSVEGRDYVTRQHDPDFNGWWCFALPVTALDSAGYPLPLFIRGDDVEYGYRLKQLGFRTIPWPGIAVWHAPFYRKRHPWHYFYDKRNALFLNEMHHRFSKLQMAGHLLVGFLNHMLRYDYARSWMSAEGLHAFNRGPSALVQWTALHHGGLSAQRNVAQRPITAAEIARIPSAAISRWYKGPAMLLRALWDLSIIRRSQGTPVLLTAEDWRPITRNRRPAVEVAYADEAVARTYRHDRQQARRCTAHMLRALYAFLARRRLRGDLVKKLTEESSWRSYLNIEPKSLPAIFRMQKDSLMLKDHAQPVSLENRLADIQDELARATRTLEEIRTVNKRSEDLLSIHDNRTRHLFHYLYDIAKKESAEFVYNNLDRAVLLHSHLELLKYAIGKAEPGDVLEFGVYTATSTNHVADLISPRPVYGFDSFQGLREDWVGHVALAGGFGVAELPAVRDNVILVQGWVQDTLPPFLDHRSEKSISFVHFDLDTYDSSKFALETVAPYLTDRAVIVFDEFHSFPGWKVGEKRAFDEWLPGSGYDAAFIGFAWEQAAIELNRQVR